MALPCPQGSTYNPSPDTRQLPCGTMLDGLYSDITDRFWNRIAKGLVRLGLQPNQVTWIGLGLVVTSSLAYLGHRSSLILGLCLVVAFAFDALDGAVARLRGNATLYGGYLDAVLDRYQELVVVLAIAYVNGFWISAFVLITGSMLTSYNKARVAVEIPIDNRTWPDLIERLERLVLLCVALLLDGFISLPDPLPERFLLVALVVLGVLTHITAGQRFLRARAILLRH